MKSWINVRALQWRWGRRFHEQWHLLDISMKLQSQQRYLNLELYPHIKTPDEWATQSNQSGIYRGIFDKHGGQVGKSPIKTLGFMLVKCRFWMYNIFRCNGWLTRDFTNLENFPILWWVHTRCYRKVYFCCI